MPQIFDIDNDAFVILTNKMEQMHRSVLPNAIRGTLNGLALDVKKNTMPAQSSKDFVNREKNFFKANSTVNFARGFDIDQMSSMIGFRGKGQAIEDLEKQEHGGKIKGRSFIATDSARVSKNRNRKVSTKNQIRKIRNVVRTGQNNTLPKAVHQAGVGNHVLHGNMLFRIDSINGRRFKLKAIYSYRKGRSVDVNATHFMEKSTMRTAKKAPEIYKKEAERQFSRYFRK